MHKAECIDKLSIAKSFGSAASTYDRSAYFQQLVGKELLGKLATDRFESILDLGCGTGYFTNDLSSRLISDYSYYLGMDLSEGMARYASEHHAGHNVTWLVGDAEQIPLLSESVDLVYSSLAIQWCDSVTGLLDEVYRVLRPGGRFAFSTLVDGSLIELKSAWAEVDEFKHVNDFLTTEQYQSAISSSKFSMDLLEQKAHELKYEKVRQLTSELKGIGAHNMNSGRQASMMGKSKVRKFVESYELYRSGDGLLPATYETLFVVLRKPS